MAKVEGEPNGSGNALPVTEAKPPVPEVPLEETCCRNPDCRSKTPCLRHRCDYPGAGA